MRVILKENIDNLGEIGDVVRVSNGYARNFLIPRNLVAPANEKNVSQLEHQRRILSKKKEQQRSAYEVIAQKLGDHSVNIARKVGANDKLFGSVSTADIADELKKAGFDISRKQIQLDEPIKALGVHSVSIKFLPELAAVVKVWVVKEESH